MAPVVLRLSRIGMLVLWSMTVHAWEPLPEDPTTVIERPTYLTQNHFEFGLFPLDFAVPGLYIQHPYAVHAEVGYHFFDWLSLEGAFGYVFLHRENDSVIDERRSNGQHNKVNSLPGLWQTVWNSYLNLQWSPIYGDLSVANLIETRFQTYMFVGGGLDYVERGINQPSAEAAFRPLVNLGLGTRVFIADQVALRAQWRQGIYKNPAPPSGDVGSTGWLELGMSLFL